MSARTLSVLGAVILLVPLCSGASASFNQGSNPLPIAVAWSGGYYQGIAYANFTGTASKNWLVNITKYDGDIKHVGINGQWVEEAYVSEVTDSEGNGSFGVSIKSDTQSNNPAVWMSIYWDEDNDYSYDGDEDYMCGAWAYTY